MQDSVDDLQVHAIGASTYRFRTPDLYDPPKMRRVLGRQRVRRPSTVEIRVAALRGIEELAERVDEPDEGRHQKAILEEWYALLDPIREDDIDEPDPMKRGEELLARERARRERIAAIYADVMAIEANLERHWPPYADLTADRTYWDDVSRIEVVRLLLVSIDGRRVDRDEDGMMAPAAYRAIPPQHRVELANFAFGLMTIDEGLAKN